MGSNISKRGGRGHGKEKNEDKSTLDENDHGKKKELKDYRYYLGTATQSSEYQKTTDFIVNHIKNEFDNSGDITLALKNLQEYDFSQYRPQLKLSDSSDPTIKRVTDKQWKIECILHYKEYKRRVNVYKNKPTESIWLWRYFLHSSWLWRISP